MFHDVAVPATTETLRVFDMPIIGRDRRRAVATAWVGPATCKTNFTRGRLSEARGSFSHGIKCGKVRVGRKLTSSLILTSEYVTHFHHREI